MTRVESNLSDLLDCLHAVSFHSNQIRGFKFATRYKRIYLKVNTQNNKEEKMSLIYPQINPNNKGDVNNSCVYSHVYVVA